MKQLNFIIILILFTIALHAQQNPPRLIVRGDDMGYTHSGNEALIKTYTNGIVTSIEVIVPSPWFPEAVKMLQANPGVDVGIHLALTSEWDNVKWRPLTDCSSLKDADGYFYPMVFPNRNYPGRAILENQWKIEDVEKEFRAQIELGMKYLPHISHISGHMGCSFLSEEVRALTNKLAKEYKLLTDTDLQQVEYMRVDWKDKNTAARIDAFITALSKLEPGKTYVFVEHPGLYDAELKAVHHIGYENVAEDRQSVTEVFTSEKVKAAIKEKGIELIGYRDLEKSK